MGTATEIRDGLKTRLVTITGLNGHARWPDQINLPAAAVEMASGVYDEDFEEGATYRFRVVLLAAALQRGFDAAQSNVDQYIVPTGTKSIKAAIEADKTLGGKADSVRVTGFSDYGVLEVNAVQYWGCAFDVEVYA